jgi:hypothetical protein
MEMLSRDDRNISFNLVTPLSQSQGHRRAVARRRIQQPHASFFRLFKNARMQGTRNPEP